MSIYQDKSGIYHVALCINGQRVHRRMARGEGKKEATALETALTKEITEAQSRRATNEGDPLLTDVMALYLEHAKTLRSEKTAREHAVALGSWLIDRRASETPDVVDEIIADMKRDGYAVATINRRVGCLKKALGLASVGRNKLTTINYGADIRRMPENNARDVFLSIAEVRRLADCASEQCRAAIWIAVLTGMRRGEILKIRPEDIRGDVINIPAGNTKTERRRVVPITAPLRPWLKYIPLRVNFEGLKTAFQRARVKAGMPHVNFHDLRHSCASLLIEAGTQMETVSKVLGHTTTKMTERYVHIRPDRQRAALEQAFGSLAPEPSPPPPQAANVVPFKRKSA